MKYWLVTYQTGRPTSFIVPNWSFQTQLFRVDVQPKTRAFDSDLEVVRCGTGSNEKQGEHGR